MEDARRALRARAEPERIPALQRYFKTGPGEYGEGDRFLGVRVPNVRAVARQFRTLESAPTLELLRSPLHEERQLALFIMVDQYRRGTPAERDGIYRTYLAHTTYINNWDLVDASAGGIVGAHLYPHGARTLDVLARSHSVWERRIAIIATGYWIHRGQYGPTLRLATRLLHDPHDLIHKAVGWMLREVGKRDASAAEPFLMQHAGEMPRTMLRYAIEHLPEAQRRRFLLARS